MMHSLNGSPGAVLSSPQLRHSQLLVTQRQVSQLLMSQRVQRYRTQRGQHAVASPALLLVPLSMLLGP